MRFWFSVILLTGCMGFDSGKGRATAKLLDVAWEGLFFKSCEIYFQYGDQSSKIVTGSTLDKTICDQAEKLIGKNVDIVYGLKTMGYIYVNSSNIILEVSEEKK